MSTVCIQVSRYVWIYDMCLLTCLLINVCMYARMYVCVSTSCICVYSCMSVCAYACIFVSTYMRTYVRMYVCMYVCIYIACKQVCIHVCMYVRMYVCMCAMCIHVYTCIFSKDPSMAFQDYSFVYPFMQGLISFSRRNTVHSGWWRTMAQTAYHCRKGFSIHLKACALLMFV